MRRIRQATVVAALTVLASMLFAGAALAQAPPYPGGSNTVTCSASSATANSTITCSADGFKANSSVAVSASGKSTDGQSWTYTTTVTANGSGVAAAVIQIPGDAVGPASVSFSGVDAGNNTRVLSSAAAFNVVSGTPAGGAAVDGDDGAPAGDGLSSTGSDVVSGLIAVAALVTVGGGLLYVTRKRSHAEA